MLPLLFDKPVKMKNTSTVSSKDQVTIPLEVRKKLGLREGDKIEFVAEKGYFFIRPARGSANPFERWAGALPAFDSLEEINHWVRDMRDQE
jgi:AbrB family looped-hinge helix DNA binding protein